MPYKRILEAILARVAGARSALLLDAQGEVVVGAGRLDERERLIGALLLYFLTVGPVRGFALFLGLSTVLDLLASYFFMRPAVVWLSRTRLATERPKTFGIPEPRALGAAQVAR